MHCKNAGLLPSCLLIAALALAGCSYSLLDRAGLSSASIAIQLKQPATPVASIALIVTAPGMPSIAETVPADAGEIVVDVPAGDSRTFTLLVNTATLVFKAETTVDLDPGESRTITLAPSLFSTPLIVPDMNNYRIVQLTDMSGGGWTARKGMDVGYLDDYEFEPHDVDFDSRGRILIANSNYTYGGVIRLDSIDDSQYEVISTGYAVALAVDRNRGYVYYCNGSSPLKRCSLDPLGTEETFDVLAEPEMSGNFATTGIAVDDSGVVYLTNHYGMVVAKYDPTRPAGSRVVATYTSNLSRPWDLLVKPPYVYLVDQYAEDGFLFTRLDMTYLSYVDSFGTPVDVPDPAPKEFWGPSRFVATINKKVTLIDEYDYEYYDRLVSFDEPDGSNWQTYGEYGSGVGQFMFYNSY